ncbi:MAG: nucleotidyltransferase domain-containing protein [Eubacteriales bacterium]|nr:nucleotidyltransferase domain-containing protein [Eubacteriales bacterium]
MYQHHRDSIEKLKEYFKDREGVIALILGGSVAKGCEREDSDLDAMVIISQQAYAERAASNTTVETIFGHCTYPGGYFDVKYMTKEYLEEAAQKASEPTRNSFIGARVLFSADPEIEGIVNRIPVFQKQEKEAKMASFYSNFHLNYYYFLRICKPEGYMRMRCISEMIYSIYRMVLQENEVLFPCNRRLEATVEQVDNRPENLVELGKTLARAQDDQDAERFAQAYLDWTKYPLPQDMSKVLSRYTADFEQWWRVPAPLVAEW